MTIQLTKEQWYTKLKTLVPSWVWEQEVATKAYFEALAKCATELQGVLATSIDDTFITRATRGVLDAHGDERSITRLTAELDSSYAIRVQNMVNKSNLPALKAFIDQILVTGVCQIQEDWSSGIFASRDMYLNRGFVFLDDFILNTFSVVVDKQTHPPYSFMGREFFCDREDYIGSYDSLDSVFVLIRQIVNDNKAFGTLYRILEMLE